MSPLNSHHWCVSNTPLPARFDLDASVCYLTANVHLLRPKLQVHVAQRAAHDQLHAANPDGDVLTRHASYVQARLHLHPTDGHPSQECHDHEEKGWTDRCTFPSRLVMLVLSVCSKTAMCLCVCVCLFRRRRTSRCTTGSLSTAFSSGVGCSAACTPVMFCSRSSTRSAKSSSAPSSNFPLKALFVRWISFTFSLV